MDQATLFITRPEPEASKLSAQLREEFSVNQGLSVINLPLIAIEPLMPALLNQQLKTLRCADYDMIIFVSKPSVRYGFEAVQHLIGEQTALFAVGEATAKSVEQMGAYNGSGVTFPDVADSEHLLELIGAESIVNKKVLIIKGEHGRDLLKSGLLERGADVEELDCYQRKAIVPENVDLLRDGLKRKKNIYVLITSGAILDNLIRLSSVEIYRQISLIVIGQRLEHLAIARGFEAQSIFRIDKIDREAISQVFNV